MFAFFSSEHPFARKESILRGGCTEKILTFYHHLGSLGVHIVTSSFDWQMAPDLQYLLCVFARDCLFFVFSVRIQTLRDRLRRISRMRLVLFLKDAPETISLNNLHIS